MALTLAEKKKFFKDEILMIRNTGMQKFLIEILKEFPDYFFNDCSASPSGKYHSARLRQPDGTYVHTRLIVRLVVQLARMIDLDINRTEALIVAAVCHDMYKQGLEKSGKTVSNHPDLAVKAVKKVYHANEDIIPFHLYILIVDSMKYHYGRWGPHKMSPVETGVLLGLLHIADLVAAYLHVIVKGLDIFPEEKHNESQER